jgi:hypothetical protein
MAIIMKRRDFEEGAPFDEEDVFFIASRDPPVNRPPNPTFQTGKFLAAQRVKKAFVSLPDPRRS